MKLSKQAQEIIDVISTGRGRFIHVAWTRKVDTLKDYRDRDIRKHVTGSVRAGVEYANLAAKEGDKKGKMKWGVWLAYPFIKGHNEREYVRLTPQGSLAATYTIDGEPTTLAEIGHMLPKRKPSETLAIDVKLEDLTALGSLRY